jgi:hypothetical protein
MVAPVDPTTAAARLVALMQSALEKQRRGTAAGGPPTGTAGSKGAGTAAGSTLGLLESRLRAIGRDQADRRKIRIRVLVQTLLTQEFGSTVVNDATFQSVVDDVASSIEASPGIKRDLDRVIEHWLGAPE